MEWGGGGGGGGVVKPFYIASEKENYFVYKGVK